MILASLILGSPGWAWAAATLGLITLAMLVRGYRRAPGSAGTRCVAAVLKTTGVVMLALCLIEPLISSTRPRPGANIFVILADDSQSLQIREPGAAKNRAQLLWEKLAEGQRWQTRLQQDFDVRRYRFDERLRSLDDPAELAALGVGSSLGSSLATVARRFDGRPVAGVLLLTDGNATDLGAEPIDYAGLPPIYPVPLGKAMPARDVRIGQVTVSQTNFEQAPVTVRAEIEANGYDGREMVVELFDESDESDEAIQRQSIRIEGTEPAVLRFRIRPARPGVGIYRIRVAAESELRQFDSPEKSVEATLANNTKLVSIERPGGPYRVLYVSGRPNWEFKFLRRALEEDTEVQLVGLIRIAKREAKFIFMGDRSDSTNPLYKGFTDKDAEQAEQYDEPVLVRLGTRDDAELQGGFPKSADELFAYHAVVIDDLEAAFFTQDQMLLLKQFVSRRGGGLLMLGGGESFRRGGFRHTPIAELLPVYLDVAPTGEPPVKPDNKFRLVLTREGWLQPWVRLRETEENEKRRRASLANLQTVNRIHRIKPGATTLAHVTDDTGSHPALVVQRFGEGRTGALLTGDLWRWQLGRKPAEENDLAKAWRQTVRWLVADVPRRVELTAGRKPNQPCSPIELKVEVRDPEFKPMDNATVELIIEKPDGDTQTLQATPSDEQAGTYLATYAPRQAGGYRARADVTAADSSVVGTGRTGWAAQPAADEFSRLDPDLALLDRLAEETGGEVVRLADLERFVSDLPNRKIPVTEPWIYPLWHQPAVFLLAIACLIGEWGLRRWRGLP